MALQGLLLAAWRVVAPETTIHAGTTASTASQSLLLHPTAPTLAIVYTVAHSLTIALALFALIECSVTHIAASLRC
jgi:hypothetical protein